MENYQERSQREEESTESDMMDPVLEKKTELLRRDNNGMKYEMRPLLIRAIGRIVRGR